MDQSFDESYFSYEDPQPKDKGSGIVCQPISRRQQEADNSFDESYYSYQSPTSAKAKPAQPHVIKPAIPSCQFLDTSSSKGEYQQEQDVKPNDSAHGSLHESTVLQAEQEVGELVQNQGAELYGSLLANMSASERKQYEGLSHRQILQLKILERTFKIIATITSALQAICFIGHLFDGTAFTYSKLVTALLFVFLNIIVAINQFEVHGYTQYMRKNWSQAVSSITTTVFHFIVLNIYPYSFVMVIATAFSSLMLVTILFIIGEIICFACMLVIQRARKRRCSYLRMLKEFNVDEKFNNKLDAELQNMRMLEKQQKGQARLKAVGYYKQRQLEKLQQQHGELQNNDVEVLVSRRLIHRIIRDIIKAGQTSQDAYLEAINTLIRQYKQSVLYQINLHYFGKTSNNVWENLDLTETTSRRMIKGLFSKRIELYYNMLSKYAAGHDTPFCELVMLMQPHEFHMLNELSTEQRKQSIRQIVQAHTFQYKEVQSFVLNLLENLGNKTNIIFFDEQKQEKCDKLQGMYDLLAMKKSALNWRVACQIMTNLDAVFYQKLNSLLMRNGQEEIPQILASHFGEGVANFALLYHYMLIDRRQTVVNLVFGKLDQNMDLFIDYSTLLGMEYKGQLAGDNVDAVVGARFDTVGARNVVYAIYDIMPPQQVAIPAPQPRESQLQEAQQAVQVESPEKQQHEDDGQNNASQSVSGESRSHNECHSDTTGDKPLDAAGGALEQREIGRTLDNTEQQNKPPHNDSDDFSIEY